MATPTAHHAIVSLSRSCAQDCKRLASSDREFQHIAEIYFRGRRLLREQQQLRARIIRTYGVIHPYHSQVSPHVERLISPAPVNPKDVRRTLNVWEILEVFLSGAHSATIADFQSFLRALGLPKTSPQAVDSAIKAHPDIFEVRSTGREKTLALRVDSNADESREE